MSVCLSTDAGPSNPLETTMTSLHHCHWNWCRFTTVEHDDLVQHVVKIHLDTAEPVRRKDISLIRQVEEGSLEYPGQLLPPHALSNTQPNGQSIGVSSAGTTDIPTSSQLNISPV